MRSDRISTSPPAPAGEDTDAERPIASRQSPRSPERGASAGLAPGSATGNPSGNPTASPAGEPAADKEKEPERVTLKPDIDLQALAKLGPEAFAHRDQQRLPADLFGPGGVSNFHSGVSLPPGASFAPHHQQVSRPKAEAFDLDGVDVLFESEARLPAAARLPLAEDAPLPAPAPAPAPARPLDRETDFSDVDDPVPPSARLTPRPFAGHSFRPAGHASPQPGSLARSLSVPVAGPLAGLLAGPSATGAQNGAPNGPAAAVTTAEAIDALGAREDFATLDEPGAWEDDLETATRTRPALGDASLRARALDLENIEDLPSADLLQDDDSAADLSASHDRHRAPSSAAISPVDAAPLFELDSWTEEAMKPEPAPDPRRPERRLHDEHADLGADDAMVELRERFASGDYFGALLVADTLAGDRLHANEAELLAQQSRAALEGRYVERIGSLARVPVIAVPMSVIRELPLDNRAGFVLSRIDGISSLEMILDMCGMPQLDALRIVYELVQNGALEFV